MHNSSEERGFPMIAFLAGIVTGAALGTILAPKAGRELRSDLAGFAGDVKEKVTNFGRRSSDRPQSQAWQQETTTSGVGSGRSTP